MHYNKFEHVNWNEGENERERDNVQFESFSLS